MGWGNTDLVRTHNIYFELKLPIPLGRIITCGFAFILVNHFWTIFKVYGLTIFITQIVNHKTVIDLTIYSNDKNTFFEKTKIFSGNGPTRWEIFVQNIIK